MELFFKNKKTSLISIALVCFLVIFCDVDYVSAGWVQDIKDAFSLVIGGAITSVVMMITFVCIQVLGFGITIVVWAIVHIAEYNNFINEAAIVGGWKVVRDFCNMFFILVLLLIAFATILRYENYSMKRLLPKLIIMAVLINFSRTICGLIIDFAQVIMLTFIDAIGDTGGNYVNALGVQKYLTAEFKNMWNGDLNATSTIAGLVMGIIFLCIALTVFLVLLGVLVARIVMLWIYIVLSPLAFLLSAFPGGQSYASRWWDDFTKNVVVGPVLAFFIWLALMAVDTSNSAISNLASQASMPNYCFGPNQILCPSDFIGFVIAIGMLLGGLSISQSMGGAAGAAAGKGIGAIQKGRALAWTATKVGADYLNRKQMLGGTIPFSGGKKYTGIDLNLKRVAGNISGSFDRSKTRELSDMEEISRKRLVEGGAKGLLGYAGTGFGDHYLRGPLAASGWKQVFKGGRKKVEGLRDEEEMNKYLAKQSSVIDDEHKYNNVLSTSKTIRDQARKAGDEDKAKEWDKKVGWLEKSKDTVIKNDATHFEKNAIDAAAEAAKYTIIDYEGMKQQKLARSKELGNITSTNEDELVAQFENAVALNNGPQAAAIAMALAKIGGGNALLLKHGYNPSSGLTADEAKQAMKDGTYDQKKGFNDFVRDIFGEKLKMDEQQYLAIQNDVACIAESGGAHEYMTKPLSIDNLGRFEQTSSKKREQVKLTEKLKKEPESVIRKSNRTEYGAENLNGDFEFSDSGLAYFIAQRDIVSKEIKGKRLNTSTAKAVVEANAMAQLKKKCADAGITHYLSTETGKEEPIDKWFEELDRYGKKVSASEQHRLLKV